jgi:hypothetical protein
LETEPAATMGAGEEARLRGWGSHAGVARGRGWRRTEARGGAGSPARAREEWHQISSYSCPASRGGAEARDQRQRDLLRPNLGGAWPASHGGAEAIDVRAPGRRREVVGACGR